MTTLTPRTVQPDPALVWQAIHRGCLAVFGLGAFAHLGLAIGVIAFAVPAAVRQFRIESRRNTP